MPFDSMSLDLATRVRLAGVPVVPMDKLEAHKAEQLRLHPPGWLYLHREGVRFTLCATIAAGWAAVLIGWVYAEPAGSMVGWGWVVAPLFVSLSLRSRGPAQWREKIGLGNLPATIGARASAVAREIGVGRVTFVRGELIQNKVLLDPYLLAMTPDGCVCIGIWDGDTIIA